MPRGFERASCLKAIAKTYRWRLEDYDFVDGGKARAAPPIERAAKRRKRAAAE